MEIRYVKSEDKLEWNRFDRHLPEAVFEDKVRNKQGYVMQVDGKTFYVTICSGIIRLFVQCCLLMMVIAEWDMENK